MAGIGLLGPIEVVGDDGHPIRIGGEKPRAILAMLALHGGRVVSVPSIVDGVWGDDPPATVVNTIQVHVSTLRRALASASLAIERTAGGYRLTAPPDCVDVTRFESRVAEGRAALRGGDLDRAHEVLGDALGLWRGRPFDDLDELPFLESARPAIERSWASASVEFAECLIELGRFDEAALEAERHVAASPFDERGWAALMTASYWAGNQSDALRVYQRARDILSEELGLDPGPDLVALERAVLEHSLPHPQRASGAEAPGAPAITATGLPPAQRLVGRQQLVASIVESLQSGDRLISLVGLGGIGKTSLAVAAGHELASSCQVWFVDLSAVTDVAGAAEAVGRLVGGGPTAEPLADLVEWATSATGVMILDNLEQIDRASELVSALLDRTGSLRLLVTSRRPLRVRGERLVGVAPLAVEASGGSEGGAATLFRDRAALVRPDLHAIDADVVAAICALAAGIPLAIELAALQLRALTPQQLLDRIRDRRASPLDVTGSDDYPDRQRSLRAVLDSTMDMLTADARHVLALASTVEGPVTLDLLERSAARSAIDPLGPIADLIEAGLLARRDDGGQLMVLPPIRHYVAETEDDGIRAAAEVGIFEAVDELVVAAEGAWYGEDASVHRRRFVADAAAIEATIDGRIRRGDWERLATLALALAPFWLQDSRLTDALSTLDALRDAPLPPDLARRVRLLDGAFASYLNRTDTEALLRPALEASAAAGGVPDRLVVNGWCCLGAFHGHNLRDDEMRRCAERARETAALSGDPTLVSLARDFAAFAASHLGDVDTAIRLNFEALDDARHSGDAHALGLLLAGAAEPLLEAGRVEEAHALASEGFELARRVDLGLAVQSILMWLGQAELELDRPSTALGLLLEHLRFNRDRYPNPLIAGDALGFVAAAQAATGDDERAARTWGASVALQADMGVDAHARRPARLQRHWDESRARVGAARFDALVAAGSANASGVVASLLGGDSDGTRTGPAVDEPIGGPPGHDER